MITLKIGQKISLKIERMGINGEGIGTISGRLIFVPYALPGEEIVAEITENARNFSRAQLVKINKKSRFRVKPEDPVYADLSSSHIMHLAYPQQFAFKKDLLLLGRGKSPLLPDCNYMNHSSLCFHSQH